MTGADIVSQIRLCLAEPSQNRWPNSYLLQQANMARRQISLDGDFIEATWTYPITPNTRLYQLKTLSKILRAYVLSPSGAQQELVPTDIPTLEGDILELYDNTSGAVLGNPVQSPNFLVSPPQAYPVNTPVGGTVGTKLPWSGQAAFGGQRPSYFLKGTGWLGILPPDVATTGDKLIIDCIPTPPDLTSMQQVDIYPRTFCLLIAWKVVQLCRLGDRDTTMYQMAVAEYKAENDRLNLWRMNQVQQNKPKTFVPRTIRTDFGFNDWSGW